MYNLTKKQKEVIHKALITASDNGTLDEFTNEELKLINRAETIVNKLTIPVVVVPKGTLVCDNCKTKLKAQYHTPKGIFCIKCKD
jgi:phosphopantetheine adenylyltransferase